MTKTKSWVLKGPREMEYRAFDLPEIGPEDMLLQTKVTCICGSDPHRYLNDDGKAPYPLILGHEFAGVVEQIGEKAAQLYHVKVGDHVTVEPYIPCGHCEYCLKGYYQLCTETRCYGWSAPMNATVPPYINGAYGEHVFIRYGSKVHKLEDGISFEAGALSSVIGNGYRMIVTHGKLKPNDSVLVSGPGALGLCAVVAAKEAGVHPIIVTGVGAGDESRLALAKEFGADYTIRLDKEDGLARVMELTNGKGVDAVMECSGAVPAYSFALEAVKKLGTIVFLGMPGGKDVPVHIDTIISKELRIEGCLGQPGEVEYAMKTINKGTYPLEKMITNRFPMSQADRAMEFFINKEDPGCIRVALCND